MEQKKEMINELPQGIQDTLTNHQLYAYHLSGDVIIVDIPGVGEKRGRIGVTAHGLVLTTARNAYPISAGTVFVSIARRKTRIDCRAYLRGEVPTFRQ